jgi:acyl-CoA thioesterase YciA
MDYQLCYKVIPMPCNTNYNGDIFGGWVLSQMDLAGVSLCNKIKYGRYVTLTIDKMIFKKPVHVGDIVEIMGKVNKIGNTSILIDLLVKTTNMESGETQQVTEGQFKYVKIDTNQHPTTILT